MASLARIPERLQNYTSPSNEDSFTLVTSVLGASANWLILRLLCHALAEEGKSARTATANLDGHDGLGGGGSKREKVVVLVSWLRSWSFWKTEAKKSIGLDLGLLAQEKRFIFMDALSKSYASPATARGAGAVPTPRVSASLHGSTGRQGMVPEASPQAEEGHAGMMYLTSTRLDHLTSTVQAAIQSLKSTSQSGEKEVVLILDSPDLLLATDPSKTTSFTLSSTLLALHELTSHVIVHLSADQPLALPSTLPTSMELEGAALLVRVAHIADRVLSCRVLDTGAAKDVSGVLRVTSKGYGSERFFGSIEDAESRKNEPDEGLEKELLYLVKRDNSVRVFERGAGEGT